MKMRINKSEVMKRAWKIFKGKNPYSYSFSAALRRAWFVEKENARVNAERIERAASVIPSHGDMPLLDASRYYNGIDSYGRYFGD
jgi:hypothetical protein